ncbi:zinc protease [Actimicrobium sp. GrIS 1.19]|uniref:M16 family metallopeptidase n=1 Tax=Actimicrobium sp. GrIS 1.19 TaxID=3071708 RepID=UPI002DFBD71C|nr:zinc protease [Actimicrobium sp. GrIS 1.19]
MHTMKLLAVPAILLALAGLLTTPARAADTAALPQVAYEKYTLPNGLDVILVENHRLPLTAVNLWYHVGPANEEPGLTGFAHLFEHMMFAASKHVPRGSADKLLEGAGATDSNGSTDFDRTNYFDTVPSNQLELALWVHADRMGYLLDVLDQKALTNQIDVVRNERRQSTENTPYGIVEEAMFHQLFPKEHPYYASIIGSHTDIQSAKLGDIKNFFTRYYRPNNASLVIVGDLDKVRTKALVAKYFGSFKRGPEVVKPHVVTPPITAERRIVVTDQVELPRVYNAWLTTPAYQPGDAELSIAGQILGGGKSSRLYKSLVYDKQIAQEVSAQQASNGLTSMFVISVTARPGHDAKEIEAAINEQLQKLRTDGPDDKEVERARNTIETAMLTRLEKVGGEGMANQLNQYNQYLGDPGYLPKDIERYRKVSAADVKRVVNAQLGVNARVVVYGIPGPKELGPEVPTPALGKIAAVPNTSVNKDEPWRRKVPKGEPLKAFALPEGSRFKLANGLTVIHNFNPALPLVAAELVVRSGSDANPLDKPGLASFTAQMLEEGTTSRSAPQIADELAQLGAFMGATSSADASTVSALSLKANFGKTLDLLADVTLRPSFPVEEVERSRSSRLGELSQEHENAPAVAVRIERLALYGKQHPYGTVELGTEAAIKGTAKADLDAFWKQHYVPANAALVVSGDITLEDLKALAETRFGAWKGEGGKAVSFGPAQPTAAKVVLVDKPDAPQTAIRVATIGVARDSPDFAALQVMNAALGGLFTSRINSNLREDKGYTYGTKSAFEYHRMPGPFAVAGSIRTDVTGPAVAEIFKEVRGMIARPMATGELANARNSQILSLPGRFENNQSISASLANIYIYDLGLDYYTGLPKRFAAVTGAQTQAVAAKYLKPDNLIVIGVGDKAKILPQLEKLKLGPVELRDADGNVLK